MIIRSHSSLLLLLFLLLLLRLSFPFSFFSCTWRHSTVRNFIQGMSTVVRLGTSYENVNIPIWLVRNFILGEVHIFMDGSYLRAYYFEHPALKPNPGGHLCKNTSGTNQIMFYTLWTITTSSNWALCPCRNMMGSTWGYVWLFWGCGVRWGNGQRFGN